MPTVTRQGDNHRTDQPHKHTQNTHTHTLAHRTQHTHTNNLTYFLIHRDTDRQTQTHAQDEGAVQRNLPPKCEGRIELVLDLDEGIEGHGSTVVHVDFIRLVPRLGVRIRVLRGDTVGSVVVSGWVGWCTIAAN